MRMSPKFFDASFRCAILRRAMTVISMLAAISISVAASAQAYPNKTIRIIANSAGSNGDLSARVIAQQLAVALGQPLIVDNHGGSIAIPGDLASKAAPDGYTLFFAPSGMWLLPFMQDNLPYDPVRDFAPVTLAGSAPGILVVQPSLGAKTIKEIIALAKAKPGALNFGNPTTGSTMHIAAELLKTMAGVNIVTVPYKGAAPTLVALLGDQIQLLFALAGPVAPHLKAGRLIAVAVSSPEPTVLAPGIPTISAAGLPGFNVVLTQGLFAPAKTPAAIVQRLNQETVRVLNRPDVKEKFLSTGTDISFSTPEEFAATIKSEMSVLGKVIKDANIRAE
jgi:tripartite-type tricarboxylate transporter receptor subunit TctC